MIKKKKKIPIIFIINHSKDNKSDAKTLEKFLVVNNLNELIEDIKDQNKDEKSDDSFEILEENEPDENFDFLDCLDKDDFQFEDEDELKNNIICVNLIETKNENTISTEFGFDKILNATNYFLKKNNPFSENDFLFLEKNFKI